MTVLGFHHVLLAMPAGEEEKAVAFYEGVLGIPQLEKPESLRDRGGCWFDNGSIQIHLGVEEGFRPARKAHPALLVSDLAAIRARLEDFGAELEYQPALEGYDRIHTYDPFGNRLELLQPVGE